MNLGTDSPVLSRRQQEILQSACDGVSDKMIAAILGVSPRTLESHWRAIHHKLGTANRCQAGFLFAALRENPQGKILHNFTLWRGGGGK